jgi:hypothetical protein
MVSGAVGGDGFLHTGFVTPLADTSDLVLALGVFKGLASRLDGFFDPAGVAIPKLNIGCLYSGCKA